MRRRMKKLQKHELLPRRLKQLCMIAIILLLMFYFGLFARLCERNFSEFEYPYYDRLDRVLYNIHHFPNMHPYKNVYNYSFLYNPANKKCKKSDGTVEKKRLVYLVKSAVENVDRRIAIRSTWGFESRFSDVKISTIFLIGKSEFEFDNMEVEEEYATFQDILVADFRDSYYNNTIKTMMGLKWAYTECNNSDFYMFVDDDMYVSTKNVLRYVRNPTDYPDYWKRIIQSDDGNDFISPDEAKLYGGYVFFSRPMRHLSSKWYVSLEEYPYDRWPPYATAGAFVLSKGAMKDLYLGSLYTKHFRFDDIYLGLIAYKLNIKPIHCAEFYFYKKEFEVRSYEYVVASHGYGDPEELRKVWNIMKTVGFA